MYESPLSMNFKFSSSSKISLLKMLMMRQTSAKYEDSYRYPCKRGMIP